MKPARVLIVEDEPSVAETLSSVLSLPEGGGYYTESCDSGETALERLRTTHFDLLVTDLRMPGMSGLTLMQEVNRISPTTRTILITAYGSPEIQAAVESLAAGFIAKPFSMQMFVQIVRQALMTQPAVPLQLSAYSDEGLAAVQARSEELRAEIGALNVLVLDHSGQLLTESYRHIDLDTRTLLVLLGNAMAAANQVTNLLEGDESFELNLHRSKRYDIYTAQVNSDVFVSMILDRQSAGTSPVGMVWLALKRAVADLRKLLVEAEVVTQPAFAPGLKQAFAAGLDEALGLGGDFEEQPQADSNPSAEATSQSNARWNPPAVTDEPQPLFTLEQARALGLFELAKLAETPDLSALVPPPPSLPRTLGSDDPTKEK